MDITPKDSLSFNWKIFIFSFKPYITIIIEHLNQYGLLTEVGENRIKKTLIFKIVCYITCDVTLIAKFEQWTFYCKLDISISIQL